MLFASVEFSGMLLARVGVGGVRAVDAQMPSMSKEIADVAPVGARFAVPYNGKKITHTVIFRVSRTFKRASDAEQFEFSHTAKLENLVGGNLRYNTKTNTYIARRAQLSGVTHERKGVGVDSTYTFTAGRIRAEWRLLVMVNGVPRRIVMQIGGADFYPTTAKIKT